MLLVASPGRGPCTSAPGGPQPPVAWPLLHCHSTQETGASCLRGPPVVGSQMTSQGDLSGPDLKGGSQKLVPCSRREMSLPRDSDPGRGFCSWGFCSFFTHHLPEVLQEGSRTASPQRHPRVCPVSPEMADSHHRKRPQRHRELCFTQLQSKELSLLFEFLLFPPLGKKGSSSHPHQTARNICLCLNSP